ncbi:uncharacterized protein [Periplaneta americana]|uniref:uncharacterized protein isoform X2 n=1 Tax=Periplaneta americana TaxID=6978 RepID=UPI0037E8E119
MRKLLKGGSSKSLLLDTTDSQERKYSLYGNETMAGSETHVNISKEDILETSGVVGEGKLNCSSVSNKIKQFFSPIALLFSSKKARNLFSYKSFEDNSPTSSSSSYYSATSTEKDTVETPFPQNTQGRIPVAQRVLPASPAGEPLNRQDSEDLTGTDQQQKPQQVRTRSSHRRHTVSYRRQIQFRSEPGELVHSTVDRMLQLREKSRDTVPRPYLGILSPVTTYVLVTGDRGTGKTSLIQRYCYNAFHESHAATLNADCGAKLIQHPDGQSTILQLRDLAGRNRCDRVFYNNARGAIIVFDVTRNETFESVLYWRGEVNKVASRLGKHIPCVLIGNKCDIHRFDFLNNTVHMDNFCSSIGILKWFEVSVKWDLNIAEAVTYVYQKIIESNVQPQSQQEQDPEQEL